MASYMPDNIGSGDDFLPVWPQAISWTNATLLLKEHLRTNFCEVSMAIQIFLFGEMHLKCCL